MRKSNHTYNTGEPYRIARGRHRPESALDYRLTTCHPIVRGFPSTAEFVRCVQRELKIRYYSKRTIKSYLSALRCFLRWFGNAPHKVTVEHVRCYLEILVDGGASSSWLAINLAAIRTSFDKFCGRDVTLGLETPRKSKRQPVVLSQSEIKRMLCAATCFDDKLLIGIIYAAGLRVSEAARLRWMDLDFDRNTIRVVQGKGNRDRMVMLPKSFRTVLMALSKESGEENSGEKFIFLTRKKFRKGQPGRHISPRTIQRIVRDVARLANVSKQVTPHSLRHAFATHLLENGTDIRFIQKLLGHQRLETTVIYTSVAKLQTLSVPSPVDRLHSDSPSAPVSDVADAVFQSDTRQTSSNTKSVGELRISFLNSNQPSGADIQASRVQVTIVKPNRVELPELSIKRNDRNWIEMELPTVDTWESSLSGLSAECQDRVCSPEFFELIRQQVASRYLARLPSN